MSQRATPKLDLENLAENAVREGAGRRPRRVYGTDGDPADSQLG